MEDEDTGGGLWASYENGFTRFVERLQGNVPEGAEPRAPAETTLGAVWDGFLWVIGNLLEAVYNILFALTHPGMWLSWLPEAQLSGRIEDPEAAQALMRVVYYGGSVEFFFAFLVVLLGVTAAGLVYRPFMWGCVRVLEGFANGVGRFFAWAALIMVLQQILIVFMQRVFAASEIGLGFGTTFAKDVSWWSEELKLYNAMIVCLCAAYTFVQGGHVRVDLIYSAVSERTKRVIDMVGCVVLMLPAAIITWMYGWYFLWRHLINPPVSASNTYEQLVEQRFRAASWNVETIGFSPNGFNAYFLFKVLLCAFALMIILQSIAFFYRSWLEWKEGPDSYGRYLDRDTLGAGEEAFDGAH
ncbi:TRAP transporter small permease subunit [Histidinibacterium lentulum]|uniref:TRAP transporter small permease protein n=1 Tax=Histidinibacterium lentulum TaxID=2480588 RepID=A0A3N2QTT0_9RHOB|nr:TRAP transporter small permease subunit [Histidinibacterium lentulum]ROT98572.1 TRAP transporter small permease subunit [Histidinibacterium lentulum]